LACIALVLSHCWTDASTFPAQISAEAPTSTCADETMAIVTVGTETPIQVLGSSGTWTLSNGPSLPGGGHQTADVDLVFGIPGIGAPAYKVTGRIDIPIVKVNVNP
jgi:hypothetical protein